MTASLSLFSPAIRIIRNFQLPSGLASLFLNKLSRKKGTIWNMKGGAETSGRDSFRKTGNKDFTPRFLPVVVVASSWTVDNRHVCLSFFFLQLLNICKHVLLDCLRCMLFVCILCMESACVKGGICRNRLHELVPVLVQK